MEKTWSDRATPLGRQRQRQPGRNDAVQQRLGGRKVRDAAGVGPVSSACQRVNPAPHSTLRTRTPATRLSPGVAARTHRPAGRGNRYTVRARPRRRVSTSAARYDLVPRRAIRARLGTSTIRAHRSRPRWCAESIPHSRSDVTPRQPPDTAPPTPVQSSPIHPYASPERAHLRQYQRLPGGHHRRLGNRSNCEGCREFGIGPATLTPATAAHIRLGVPRRIPAIVGAVE